MKCLPIPELVSHKKKRGTPNLNSYSLIGLLNYVGTSGLALMAFLRKVYTVGLKYQASPPLTSISAFRAKLLSLSAFEN